MDPSLLDRLSAPEKAQILHTMNEMQVAESMNTYNGLVERCFGECISTFREKSLDKKEDECVVRCVGKFMAFSKRVGERFAEKNAGVAQ